MGADEETPLQKLQAWMDVLYQDEGYQVRNGAVPGVYCLSAPVVYLPISLSTRGLPSRSTSPTGFDMSRI